MADQTLLAVAVPEGGTQPADLSSDAGHLFLGAQALYSAEQQADDGQHDKALEKIETGHQYFAGIADPNTQAYATSLWANALGYVQAKAQGDQVQLQEDFSARVGNYQQSVALTPDQERALLADNAQTKAAEDSSSPWLTYGLSSAGNAAAPVVDAARDAGKKLGDAATDLAGSWKWPLLIVGGILVLAVGGVVAMKVL